MFGMVAEKTEVCDHRVFTITVLWDDEAKMFVAFSDDIPGLATEAETYQKLRQRVIEVAPELLELNGVMPSTHGTLAFDKQVDYLPLHG